MPPCLDIYLLSLNRELAIVRRFVSEFAHPTANEDRTGEELMLLPEGAEHEPNSVEEYEWEPISSLQQAILRGVGQPYRAFRLYLKAGPPEIYQVMLAFRADGGIVFGLSIDDADESPSNLERARALLARMADEYEGMAGFVAWEVPPPLLGEFPPPEESRTLYTWQRGAA
jgi:hypothetical protein